MGKRGKKKREIRKNLIKKIKKSRESLRLRFMRNLEERVEILNSGIVGTRIDVQEESSRLQKYISCGYVRVPTRIGGKNYGLCALSESWNTICEFDLPMKPVEECPNYRIFMIQNPERPAMVYGFRENRNYLNIYFRWKGQNISTRIYLNGGARGNRLKRVEIRGIFGGAVAQNEKIVEKVLPVREKERRELKNYVWGNGKNFLRGFYDELSRLLPEEDYGSMDKLRNLKGKVRYVTPR